MDKQFTQRKFPSYLKRETFDGVNFYYPGFRQVLYKQKSLDDLIGDSGLLFFLKCFLADVLKAGLDEKCYRMGAGKLGFQPNANDKFELSVVVFDKTLLTPDKITLRYVTVPPKVVIEIDVNVELPERNSDLFQEYVLGKLDSLFNHGVEKVIWFFTKSKKVCIALPGQAWQINDWNQDITLFEGVKVNIADYIAQEGFKLD